LLLVSVLDVSTPRRFSLARCCFPWRNN
jgi:hypothetical protein